MSQTNTFTGGTFEWSPPEAHAGATPSPAFDVYGFGATLAFAAVGQAPRGDERGRVRRTPARRLAALPSELHKLLIACTEPTPTARPTLAECAATLAKLRELSP